MKTPALLLGALLALSLPSVVTAQTSAAKKPAATAAKAKDTATPAKRDTYPLYGEVVSINTRTLTIKGGQGKEDRKFSVSSATEVVKADKPAKLEDVVVGQWVGGLLQKNADGNDKVLKLNLSVKQKDAKADKAAPTTPKKKS